MDKDKIETVIKFLSETQMLKRVKHEGWRLAGVKDPESVTDHIAIASQIAYVLARLEGLEPDRAAYCCAIMVFHDNEEARLGDRHKVNARYLKTKEAEVQAEKEHYSLLPEPIGKELFELQEELRHRDTREGIITKDADWLEQAVHAKTLVELGYKGCENWIDNVEAALETESAKTILAEIRKHSDFLNCWWKGLKKMTYRKLS